MNNKLLRLGISISVGLIAGNSQISLALPPPEDIPEEVLRTEIITEGRSPIDGKPLTAAEYAQLQAQLAKSPYPPELAPKIRELIFLLQLRQMIKTIIPF